MKTKTTLLGALLLCISIKSFAINYIQTECAYQITNDFDIATKKKGVYTKNVWSVIEKDQKINNVVFGPLNEVIPGFAYGSYEFDINLFETRKASIAWNLWTILFYGIVNDDLRMHSPFNPDWVDTEDDGLFTYPITPEIYGEGTAGTYLTDKKYQYFCKEGYLGMTDYTSALVPIQSTVFFGNDSIDNDGNVVYYPREYYYYEDKDITSYRIRESWVIDAAGMVQDKQIEAIAPIVNDIDPRNGEIRGDKILFWINYEELMPLLIDHYVLLSRYRTERVISYLDYFEQRQFYGEVVKEDSIQINKVGK